VRSPLQTRDIARVAEFFDGSRQAAFAFARDTWIPETIATLRRLRVAAHAKSADVPFLCDHLREGARVVGAGSIIALADALGVQCSNGQWGPMIPTVDKGLRHALAIGRWLNMQCRSVA